MNDVASGFKIAAHAERLRAYLRGEAVFPVSLELDLTSRCSRTCADCPSMRAAVHWELDRSFVERLFDALAGQATGLLLTGGEPTLSSLLPGTLAAARTSGFRDIAVVTNGGRLDDPTVTSALLEHASTIRLSLYDWDDAAGDGPGEIMERIARLRRLIDKAQSPLQIGVSLLTSSERLGLLRPQVGRLAGAGAHWVYFHPLCKNWNKGRPSPEPQDGVIAEVENLQREFGRKMAIFVSRARYDHKDLSFSGYHAAHFLLVVGADRKNYLGAEVKYQPDFAIADLGNGWRPDFLRDPNRLERIRAVTDGNYPALASRHRGVLYNDFVERLKRCEDRAWEILNASPQFRFPHIL